MVTDNLVQGEKYDLTMNNGFVHKGWYLSDKKCGYFTKHETRQGEGFIYSESVKTVIKSEVNV